MKKQSANIIIIVVLLFITSCSSPKYFYDESSYNRQKEIKSNRVLNVTEDILSGLVLVSSAAILEVEPELSFNEQRFKKLKLINPTTDTIYVNMLTDLEWDQNNYCDFMDIRIPPKTTCKILVPVEAVYNLYYSNTPESEDDELLEIFTSDIARLELKPTVISVYRMSDNH